MFCAAHDCPGETITQLPDGPVVVIDGKVAGLEAAFAEFMFSNLVAVTSADEIEEAIGCFIDAAREVADHG
jgi:hypothetical protein